jgi:hypothetical protein
MVKKELTWFLVFAFVSFVILPDFAGAETVSSKINTSVAVGIEPSLPEDNSGKYIRETFSVSESLQFAQTNDSQNVIKEELKPDQAAGQESTAEKTKKGGGLSTGTVIAIIGGIVLIAVVIIAIAAANSGPNFSNTNNYGGGR